MDDYLSRCNESAMLYSKESIKDHSKLEKVRAFPAENEMKQQSYRSSHDDWD